MKKFAFPLVSAVLLLGAAQTIHGCSCAPSSPRQALRQARAVFVGKVAGIEDLTIQDDHGSEKIVRVTFTVSRFWKGISGSKAVVYTSGHEMSCAFNFEKGTEYLVYATSDHWQIGVLETGLCHRTRGINHATRDLRALGRGSRVR